MARPRKHADSGARVEAYRETHVRLDVYVSSQVGRTVTELAAAFGESKNYVVERLIVYALMNRQWKKTGFHHG